MKRGPFEITATDEIYTNPWITVHEDKVLRPDGKEGLFGVVEYASGTCVVALTEQNDIFLVKEFAYAINDYSISLPSGGIDEGESPEQAARRELREEAGVEATDFISLGVLNPFTMIINSQVHMFLARNAKIVTEHEKEFEVFSVPFDRAVAMVMSSEINHSGSCVAILKAKEILENK